jgi:hypothetical protein
MVVFDAFGGMANATGQILAQMFKSLLKIAYMAYVLTKIGAVESQYTQSALQKKKCLFLGNRRSDVDGVNRAGKRSFWRSKMS